MDEMSVLLIITQVIVVIFSVYVFYHNRMRPIAWTNLFIALLLGIGGLLYGEFYPKYQYETQLILLVQTVSLLLSLWLLLTNVISRRYKKAVFWKVNNNMEIIVLWRILMIILLTSLVIVISAIGGIDKTGLWAMFFLPDLYNETREVTFKLMENGIVKSIYLYAKILTTFTAALGYVIYQKGSNKKEIIAGILVIIIFSMLSGSRSGLVSVLLVFFIGNIIFYGLDLKKVAKMIVIIFAIVVVLSLFRSDGWGDYENIFRKIYQVTRRMFAAPFYTGIIHHDYVLNNGLWSFLDVTGFPGKERLGFDHVSAFRIVGEYSTGIETANMNTSEIFFEMSIFGVFMGGMISTIVLILYDLLITYLSVLIKDVSYPLVITFSVYSISIISTGAIGQLSRSFVLFVLVALLLFFVKIITNMRTKRM
jgi:hypothetical protein